MERKLTKQIAPTEVATNRPKSMPMSYIIKFWTRKSLGGSYLERVGGFNYELYKKYLDHKYNG